MTNNSNPWQGKVACTEIRPLDKGGNLKAYATITIGTGLSIYGCRVIQQPGQQAWVSLPQTKSGEKWYPVVKADDKRLQEVISQVVLEAWSAHEEF